MNAFQVITTGLNISLLIVAIRVTQHITRIEFKVNMMWEFFEKELNNNSKSNK